MTVPHWLFWTLLILALPAIYAIGRWVIVSVINLFEKDDEY